ncbi:hypothetical protein RUND412_009867 [Rhizina undulata]
MSAFSGSNLDNEQMVPPDDDVHFALGYANPEHAYFAPPIGHMVGGPEFEKTVDIWGITHQHNVPLVVYESLRKIWERDSVSTLSARQMQQKLTDVSDINYVEYEMCSHGHRVFTGEAANLEECDGFFAAEKGLKKRQCMKKRGSHAKKMQYIGLIQRFKKLYSIVSNGYQPFQSTTTTTTPIVVIILNLPPEERYKEENMLLVASIPGPKPPKDMQSFIFPLRAELDILEGPGVRYYDAKNQEYFTLYAHIVLITGDLPAIAKLMGYKGPNAKLECRFCTIKGYYHEKQQHIYFPLTPPNDKPNDATSYDASRLPRRHHSHLIQIFEKLAACKT